MSTKVKLELNIAESGGNFRRVSLQNSVYSFFWEISNQNRIQSKPGGRKVEVALVIVIFIATAIPVIDW